MLPFHELSIGADGKGLQCCNDWHDTYDLGNVNTVTLKEIWQSKAMEDSSDLLRKGIRAGLCSKCDFIGFRFESRKVGQGKKVKSVLLCFEAYFYLNAVIEIEQTEF